MNLQTTCLILMVVMLLATGGAVFLAFWGGRKLPADQNVGWRITWLIVSVLFLAGAGLWAGMWHTESHRSPLEPAAHLFERR